MRILFLTLSMLLATSAASASQSFHCSSVFISDDYDYWELDFATNNHNLTITTFIKGQQAGTEVLPLVHLGPRNEFYHYVSRENEVEFLLPIVRDSEFRVTLIDHRVPFDLDFDCQ